MSVNVGQVFLQVSDVNAVALFLAEFLKELKSSNAVFLDSGKFRDADGTRKILILPPVRGWITLLESDFRNSDLRIAGAASEYFKCRAIGIEVVGCVFDFKWAMFESGEQIAGEVLSDSYPTSGTLPFFKDAEQLAWEQAGILGLPTETLFLRMQDIQNADETAAPNGALVTLTPEGAAMRLVAVRVRLVLPPARTDPRCFLDLVTGLEANTPEGIAFAIEQRYLWGTPDKQSLESLFNLLRRIQTRYERECGLRKDQLRFIVRAGEECSLEVTVPPDLGGGAPPKPDGKLRRRPFE